MKILLVPGNPGWAFDHRAKDLLSLSYDRIQLEMKYVNRVKGSDRYQYDVIYPMSVNIAKKLHEKTNIPYKQMATGITSLRVLDKYNVDFLQLFRGLNTASNEIVDMLKGHVHTNKTRVGVDPRHFKPAESKKKKRPFVVGWVGRIDQQNYRELKGYDLVISALKDMNVNLQIRTFKDKVPRKEMVAFYQELDCFICSSTSEHIPLPVLEAAACGVPIISTNVGIVPELISDKRNGIIVKRDANAIKNAVQTVKNNPEMKKQLSGNIRATILEGWTLEKCKSDWEDFFSSL
ncbi:glycosyltransferase [Salicibibacter halophilus]|uniref:Glycosyltransferase n=1 Tax=Salicibibacter halophilus TaxID=2502791 RepID=A0A514LMS4_9BACI|nr:glycosyltransferase family 4 protein [Salicibibacter halophilus]QDI92865.1 glycosyltransferase [Salicibibacter halophilus]